MHYSAGLHVPSEQGGPLAQRICCPLALTGHICGCSGCCGRSGAAWLLARRPWSSSGAPWCTQEATFVNKLHHASSKLWHHCWGPGNMPALVC